jgi:hypothetical protein
LKTNAKKPRKSPGLFFVRGFLKTIEDARAADALARRELKARPAELSP